MASPCRLTLGPTLAVGDVNLFVLIMKLNTNHGEKPSEFDLYLGGITYGNIDKEGITNDFSGLHLYIINSSFFDKFLSIPEHGDIDRCLANMGSFVVCNPFVATQCNGISDNTGKYHNYDLHLKNRKMFGA